MAITEQIEPLDAAIFADTGWEPAAVYEHMDWLRGKCERAGLPLLTVSGGNLRTDVLARTASGRSVAQLPFHLAVEDRNTGTGHGILRRNCTRDYKIVPIQRQLRALAGMTGKRWRGEPVEQWLGISYDEVGRMRDSRDKWIMLRYPLVERRMRRSDCVTWLESNGFPTPPKSACIGCPFHGDATWQMMRRDRPGEFADAVAFDAAARTLPGLRSLTYLHRSLLPLADVDLSTPAERGQASLFDLECEGHCGI